MGGVSGFGNTRKIFSNRTLRKRRVKTNYFVENFCFLYPLRVRPSKENTASTFRLTELFQLRECERRTRVGKVRVRGKSANRCYREHEIGIALSRGVGRWYVQQRSICSRSHRWEVKVTHSVTMGWYLPAVKLHSRYLSLPPYHFGINTEDWGSQFYRNLTMFIFLRRPETQRKTAILSTAAVANTWQLLTCYNANVEPWHSRIRGVGTAKNQRC